MNIEMIFLLFNDLCLIEHVCERNSGNVEPHGSHFVSSGLRLLRLKGGRLTALLTNHSQSHQIIGVKLNEKPRGGDRAGNRV